MPCGMTGARAATTVVRNMKITAIDTFVVDAGWRAWLFVAVRTDEGVTGYGECSDPRMPFSVEGTVHELASLLIGGDPLPVAARYWDLYRPARQSPGGVAAKAIAGIELALWDIRAKTLGVPVYALFGGPLRDRQRVYWSHCGTSRVRSHELIGVPPLRSWQDVAALGKEVVQRGFTALKTNIIYPGDPARLHLSGFGGGPGTTDGTADHALIDHVRTQIGTLRDAVGPHVDIALDLNFNFRVEAATRICRALEEFRPMWVEVDLYHPAGLRAIRDRTAVPVCSGENLFTARDYRPYFEAGAMDVCMIDVPWNGFAEARKVADMAETFELNCAPHNYYSHLSTLHSLHLCAVIPNVRICEVDIDDVPWKDELVTAPPVYEAGAALIPDGPGWGADLNEEVARAHPWRGDRH